MWQFVQPHLHGLRFGTSSARFLRPFSGVLTVFWLWMIRCSARPVISVRHNILRHCGRSERSQMSVPADNKTKARSSRSAMCLVLNYSSSRLPILMLNFRSSSKIAQRITAASSDFPASSSCSSSSYNRLMCCISSVMYTSFARSAQLPSHNVSYVIHGFATFLSLKNKPLQLCGERDKFLTKRCFMISPVASDNKHPGVRHKYYGTHA